MTHRPPPIPPIDWFRVIVDLERKGWRHRNIASAAGINRTTVLGLKNIPGTQPKHNTGERMIALWLSVMGAEAHHVPRESVGNSDTSRTDTPPVPPIPTAKDRPHGHQGPEAPHPWRSTERRSCQA